MRTIISQNGKMIVNAEKLIGVAIEKLDNVEYTLVAHDILRVDEDCGETIGWPLGEYSTETRALRVLDMLNEWLTMQRTFSCFRMPKDSEELDA